jgi:two-component sensor histidine kinase
MLATSIPQLVFRSRNDGRRSWGSPQWEIYAGLSDAESREFGWVEAVHPDDRQMTLDRWRDAQISHEHYVEHRIRRASDGQYRWHQTRARPAGDWWVGTSADVHEMRSLQDRQQVLLSELQHRTRNLLALVQAIARQTLRSSASLADFAREFESRLGALSRVQGLLARADQSPIDLQQILAAELDAHGGARAEIAGPSVELEPIAAQALALALHELATNAVKYGALHQPQGKLSVAWKVDKDQGQPRLILEWLETAVIMPPPSSSGRKGYGRELIERALPYQLNATTHLEFTHQGVRCTIEMPLDMSK